MFKSAKLKRSPYFYLNGKRILTVKSLKILGIIIDSQLNWISHALYLKGITYNLGIRLLSVSRIGWGVSGENLKIWYRLVIERIIAYAAPAWADRLNSYVIKVLRSIQRIFAIRITRCNRHVSTEAVIQLAGLIPIELVLVKESSVGKLFRLKSTITIDNVTFEPSNVDLPVSRWFMPPFNFRVFDSIVTEVPDPPIDAISYYTDGSKMEDGVGSSFCIVEQNLCLFSWNAKLSVHNTIFQAEALAVHQALLWHLNQFPNRSFVIYSDSQSVLKALCKVRQTNKTLQEIIKLFTYFRGNYGVITWVRAHIGVVGNEIADSLAKQAASPDFNGDSMLVPISKSYVKSLADKFILDSWQRLWDSSTKGRFTYRFLPTVSTSHLFCNYLLNLFITNRGPFPSFLHYIGKLDSPDCICSGYGDAAHYIFDCTLTQNFHFIKPNDNYEALWFANVIKYDCNISKICRLVNFL